MGPGSAARVNPSPTDSPLSNALCARARAHEVSESGSVGPEIARPPGTVQVKPAGFWAISSGTGRALARIHHEHGRRGVLRRSARLPGGAMRVISRERVHILDISFTQAIR